MYTVYASQSIETDELQPEIIRWNQTHHLGMLAPCDTTTLLFVGTSQALIAFETILSLHDSSTLNSWKK